MSSIRFRTSQLSECTGSDSALIEQVQHAFPHPPTGLQRVTALDTSAVDGAHDYDREFDFRRVVVAEHFVQKRTELLRSMATTHIIGSARARMASVRAAREAVRGRVRVRDLVRVG